jgi:DNA-binding XRE family transcriptional regulator
MMLDPQAINPLTLPSVPLEMRSLLPQTPCIYFAIDSQGMVQYIGQSGNLQLRWECHHRQKQLELVDGITIAWLTIDSPQLLIEIEAALINWFNPPLNFIKPRLQEVPEEGEIIERLRSRSGLTQKQVADQLKMTVQTISNWETGVRVPRLTPKQTLILCRVLECTLEELASDNQGQKAG